jgi:DNA-directed RNA polymerase subunit RPC12/RpoP
MAQVGKRYKCETCGTEILVTKGGDGEPCGTPMVILQAKRMASAD